MPPVDDSRTHLLTSLREKRLLYDQMIADNKEFDEVKSLFVEIKELEQILNSEKETT